MIYSILVFFEVKLTTLSKSVATLDNMSTPDNNDHDPESSLCKWDDENPEVARLMMLAMLFGLVSNLKDLCRSINPTHRYFNMVAAFAKRASKEFDEWKKTIKEDDCGYHQPRKFIMQLLKALNDSIRKMKQIAVSAPVEKVYDENLWEEMKMMKTAEEKDANKAIFSFTGPLKALDTELCAIRRLPKTEYNASMEQQALEQDICDLIARRNSYSKILNEMDMRLTKQLTDFASGLQKSQLYEIIIFIPQTDSGPNRKRSIDCITLTDSQCMLQFD